MDKKKLEARLRIALSDLKDCRSTTVLRKYPHLGDPAGIAKLGERIQDLRRQLAEEV